MDDAQLADVAPVGPVLGEGDPFEAVGDAAEDLRVGAVREGGVVGTDELIDRGGVGDDNGGDRADAEVHEGAVPLEEAVEAVVGGGAEEWDAAEEREPERARRERLPRGPPSEVDEAEAAGEKGEDDDGERHGELVF